MPAGYGQELWSSKPENWPDNSSLKFVGKTAGNQFRICGDQIVTFSAWSIVRISRSVLGESCRPTVMVACSAFSCGDTQITCQSQGNHEIFLICEVTKQAHKRLDDMNGLRNFTNLVLEQSESMAVNFKSHRTRYQTIFRRIWSKLAI